MAEALPGRMLREDAGPRELVLAPLPFLLSRARAWQGADSGEGQALLGEPRNKEGPRNSCFPSGPRSDLVPGVPNSRAWGALQSATFW